MTRTTDKMVPNFKSFTTLFRSIWITEKGTSRALRPFSDQYELPKKGRQELYDHFQINLNYRKRVAKSFTTLFRSIWITEKGTSRALRTFSDQFTWMKKGRQELYDPFQINLHEWKRVVKSFTTLFRSIWITEKGSPRALRPFSDQFELPKKGRQELYDPFQINLNYRKRVAK